MALRRPLVVIASLVSTLAVSSAASAAPHPHVLFDASDVPAIRARLAGPLKPIADAVRAGVDYPFQGGDFPKTPDLGYQYFDDRRAIADTVFAYAFASMVWGNDPSDPIGQEANQLAHDYLVGVCNYDDWVFPETQDSPTPDLNLGHFLFSVSLAYDVAAGVLSDAERATCRAKIATEGAKMYDAATNGAWWVEEYLQNHNWIDHGGLGVAAIAFDGEISADTKAWLDVVNADYAKVHQVLDLIDGGAWHEGPGYLNYGLDTLIPFSIANERIGGESWADVAIVRDYPRFRLFSMPPATAHRREYMVYGDYSGFQEDNTVLPLRYVAKTKKDALAAFAADYFTSGETLGQKGFTSWPPSHRGPILSAVVYDESVKPSAAPKGGAAWSLDEVAGDLSFFESRSGFDDGDAMLGLKTGVYGGHANWKRIEEKGAPGGSLDFGHDHADDMGVHFFADGEWMTTTVPAYFIGRDNGSPEGNKTRYANSLLVDDTGQLGEGVRPDGYEACPWFFERESSIPITGSTAHYAFALGAGSKLYDPSLGLKTFGRAVFFVDRKIPVVRDVVELEGTHQVDVVWHALDGITKDGDWLELAGKNDRALGLRVLSPASWDYTTESQTADHTDKFDEDDGQLTAAMIHPTTPAPRVTFLEALVPARVSNWDGRMQVDAIDASTPERGAVLKDASGDRSDVVMADDPGSTASGGGLDLVGMAGARRVSGGKTTRAVLAAGTKLAIDGTTWIEVLAGAPATIEVEVVPGGVAISGDAVAVKAFAPGATSVTVNGVATSFTKEGDYVRVGATGGGAGGAPGSAGSTGTAGAAASGAAGASAKGGGGAGAKSGAGGSTASGGTASATGNFQPAPAMIEPEDASKVGDSEQGASCSTSRGRSSSWPLVAFAAALAGLVRRRRAVSSPA